MSDGKRKQAGHQMQIRFPEGSDLRERLMECARANNRSLTAEIIWRLEVSLGGTTVLPAEQIHDMILSDLNEKMEAAWQRLDWLDDHFKVDSRPAWVKAKPNTKRSKKG